MTSVGALPITLLSTIIGTFEQELERTKQAIEWNKTLAVWTKSQQSSRDGGDESVQNLESEFSQKLWTLTREYLRKLEESLVQGRTQHQDDPATHCEVDEETTPVLVHSRPPSPIPDSGSDFLAALEGRSPLKAADQVAITHEVNTITTRTCVQSKSSVEVLLTPPQRRYPSSSAAYLTPTSPSMTSLMKHLTPEMRITYFSRSHVHPAAELASSSQLLALPYHPPTQSLPPLKEIAQRTPIHSRQRTTTPSPLVKQKAKLRSAQGSKTGWVWLSLMLLVVVAANFVVCVAFFGAVAVKVTASIRGP